MNCPIMFSYFAPLFFNLNKIFCFLRRAFFCRDSTKLLEGVYETSYFFEGKKYKIRHPKAKGIRHIMKVSSGENDITPEILELMGPGRNFHGIPVTPSLLGWEEMEITYFDGSKKRYESSDTLLLKLENHSEPNPELVK